MIDKAAPMPVASGLLFILDLSTKAILVENAQFLNRLFTVVLQSDVV